MNDFSLGEVVCRFQCGLVASSYEGRISDNSVWVENQLQAQEDENMGNLKKLIEANTTDYYSTPESAMELEVKE